MDLDPEKLAHNAFVAGGLGSLVALRFAPGNTWAERAGNVAAGAACAGFLSPGLGEWLHVETPGMRGAMAFAVGMFGLSLAAAVQQALRELKLAEIISGWISRR